MDDSEQQRPQEADQNGAPSASPQHSEEIQPPPLVLSPYRLQLAPTAPGEAPRCFGLHYGANTIGRCTPDLLEPNFISIDNANVALSRLHASITIAPNNDGWLRDLGSTNGTQLAVREGEGVMADPQCFYQLSHGMVITLGDLPVLFIDGNAGAGASNATTASSVDRPHACGGGSMTPSRLLQLAAGNSAAALSHASGVSAAGGASGINSKFALASHTNGMMASPHSPPSSAAAMPVAVAVAGGGSSATGVRPPSAGSGAFSPGEGEQQQPGGVASSAAMDADRRPYLDDESETSIPLPLVGAAASSGGPSRPSGGSGVGANTPVGDRLVSAIKQQTASMVEARAAAAAAAEKAAAEQSAPAPPPPPAPPAAVSVPAVAPPRPIAAPLSFMDEEEDYAPPPPPLVGDNINLIRMQSSAATAAPVTAAPSDCGGPAIPSGNSSTADSNAGYMAMMMAPSRAAAVRSAAGIEESVASPPAAVTRTKSTAAASPKAPTKAPGKKTPAPKRGRESAAASAEASDKEEEGDDDAEEKGNEDDGKAKEDKASAAKKARAEPKKKEKAAPAAPTPAKAKKAAAAAAASGKVTPPPAGSTTSAQRAPTLDEYRSQGALQKAADYQWPASQRLVACLSGMDTQDRERVAHRIRLMGGAVVDDWAERVTLLVVRDSPSARTPKFLMSLAKGVMVVTARFFTDQPAGTDMARLLEFVPDLQHNGAVVPAAAVVDSVLYHQQMRAAGLMPTGALSGLIFGVGDVAPRARGIVSEVITGSGGKVARSKRDEAKPGMRFISLGADDTDKLYDAIVTGTTSRFML